MATAVVIERKVASPRLLVSASSIWHRVWTDCAGRGRPAGRGCGRDEVLLLPPMQSRCSFGCDNASITRLFSLVLLGNRPVTGEWVRPVAAAAREADGLQPLLCPPSANLAPCHHRDNDGVAEGVPRSMGFPLVQWRRARVLLEMLHECIQGLLEMLVCWFVQKDHWTQKYTTHLASSDQSSFGFCVHWLTTLLEIVFLFPCHFMFPCQFCPSLQPLIYLMIVTPHKPFASSSWSNFPGSSTAYAV